MIDVFELCKSETFLAGGVKEMEKRFEFPPKLPWLRRVTDVNEYIASITPTDSDDPGLTPWHILEEKWLGQLRQLFSKIRSIGTGPIIEGIQKKRSEFDKCFGTVTKTWDLALTIGRTAKIDGERLYRESLKEASYSHLALIMTIQDLLPNVTFPILSVMTDAFIEGLMPYGVFNGLLDETYAGPEVLLCIDPANLSA